MNAEPIGGAGAAAGVRGRIGPVDSLRCFAMTAVVAQHCGLLPFGWTGVWLFFVISGYVVTLSAMDRPRGPDGLRSFFARRCVRILPVYLAYLCAGVIVAVALGVAIEPAALLSLLTFTHNLAMIVGRGEMAGWSVGHLWTISVEMQFYLIYGVVLFACARRTVIRLLLAALLLGPTLRAGASIWLQARGWADGNASYAIYAGPFLHVDVFAAGALLAFAEHGGLLRRVARPLFAAGAAALAVYCVVFMGMNVIVRGREGVDILRDVISGVPFGDGREVLLYSALAAASAGVVALAATDDRFARGLLAHRITQRIGVVSYGAYVYHGVGIGLAYPALRATLGDLLALDSLLGRLILFSLAFALTLLFAEVSFRTVERWFLVRRAAPRSSAAGDGARRGLA
jgi:peptidoglycan/LPS O-acetylase OafA/YrhL